MDAFEYEAVDAKGRTKRGTVMASNARAARRELRGRNLTPLNMYIANTGSTAKVKTATTTGKVKLRLLTQATRQLAILIKADTPVSEALSITALQFENMAMRKSFLDVRSQILEGQRFSQALAKQPKTYSGLYTSMVAAGENSGHLGDVLARLATNMEASQKVRRKVLGATIYPMVLSVVALAVIVILMVFVVPKVVQQFESFHQKLPRLTEMTIGFSHWLQQYGLWAFIAIIGAMILARQSLKLENIRYGSDKALLKLPLIGRLNRQMNAARFARTMSGLLASGTPVMSAINVSKNTLKNTVMRKGVEQAIEQVRGGSSLGGALKKTQALPPLMVHMISSGETSGELAHMFEVSADYLEDEFDSTVTIVLNLLEPLIIILLGGVVLLIVAAIFLPILRLNTLSF
jgi:general secretion pathway protein F